MIRVFEAFAGYGSQRMALRNLGIEHEVVAISEFDKYADASYQAIHGETWNMGDITKIDVDDVPDHDLFTYSFPCQDISIAGNQEGFSKDSGTRSGLLWESERIIKAKKPKYLLMENVKNLVGKRFMPGFQEWIDYLASIGYSNYWEVLNAKDFGIPQNRERVFMVSVLGEHKPYVFPKPIKLEKRLKDVLEAEVDEKYYLSKKIQDRLTIKLNMSNEIKTIGSTKGKYNTRLGQRDVVYSSKGIMGALSATDYKQPKQIGEPEIKQVLQYNSKNRENTQRYRTYDTSGVAPTLNTMQGGGLHPHIPEPSFVIGSTQKNASVTDGSYSPTLTSSMGTGGGHVPMIDEPKVNKIDITQKVMVRKHKVDTGKLVQTLRNHKKITNREIAEKLDRPITQVEHWFRTDDSFSIPNPDIWYELKEMLEIKTDEFDKPITEFIEEDGVYEKAERHYFTDGIAPTLTSTSADEKIIERQPIIAASRGRNPNNPSDRAKGSPTEQRLEFNKDGVSNTLTTVQKDNYVVNGYRIRKLTPLECFRLMDVTDEDFYKAQAVNSNSQLYKQAGNSIVVSVLEAIFRNMFLEVPDEDLVGEHISLF